MRQQTGPMIVTGRENPRQAMPDGRGIAFGTEGVNGRSCL